MRFTKTFRRIALGSMFGTTALMASSQALAAVSMYIAVKGAKTGQFKGESIQDKRKDKWIPVLSFSFGMRSPRDAATGQAAGKRQWDQLCIHKEAGAATPQFFNSASQNEVLPEVSFEFAKTSMNGQEQVYQTIKLTNAQIAAVHQSGGDPTKHTTATDGPVDEVCFTFQRIDIQNNEARTMATDEWTAR